MQTTGALPDEAVREDRPAGAPSAVSQPGGFPAAAAEAEPPIQRYYLTLFQRGAEAQGYRGSFTRALVGEIQQRLDDTIKTPPAQTDIDVWLDSPGGDPHAAYKLMLDLRSRCRTLRVVIPDYAKSAATLFALGMDVIFMAPAAELGPLDIQIPHPDKDGVTLSGLDVVGSLTHLSEVALEMTLRGGAGLIDLTKLPRIAVVPAMLKFAADFLHPAVAQIDPQLLHRAGSQLDIADRYARILLVTRNGSRCEHQLTDGQAAGVIQRLIKKYPAHGFVISRDEATHELRLPIEPAETYPRWADVTRLLRAWSQEDDVFITLWTDDQLDAGGRGAEAGETLVRAERPGANEDELRTAL
jgi:hypothetical protein